MNVSGHLRYPGNTTIMRKYRDIGARVHSQVHRIKCIISVREVRLYCRALGAVCPSRPKETIQRNFDPTYSQQLVTKGWQT